MSKASKDGECFMALEIKRPKWILKGKDRKFCHWSICVSERSRTFIQGSPFILGYKTNKPTVFSSTIHLELLWFCHERRNVTSFLVRRRRNELLFHLWSSNGGRCHSLLIWLVSQNYHHYGLWAIINVNGVIIRKVT
jgi:hypothetical protein